ncbi:hypothetical protein B0A78_10955 [Flavobacterium columnare NBRC 100251 = ATCC 23463]|uniref:hypothetical protein n=1 Tax=Flavobacterium columnare TaxID=996 RepID=UPI0007F98F93|nr:hypothetical protein [Flavobacterium columnare]ANO48701.1 hypothetical protein Pf1_00453 [Flavobacterium columnare]APT23262.1 hypothetical protein BU993_11905 [Flavobacterium columnare]PDS22906.1 hypothetical protein B0A78_10955 [Flavobacterium columnare NBRC 100251 = ATCC 23463]PTD15155.1 hypothetical protein C6N29_12365 [Flavobacterium columnare]GEM59050.1 hypothetical protein FC1_22880 [Flavobacterium columnare NBRC 100251 = ATCC 23463]
MSILNNIKKVHILKAIERIDAEINFNPKRKIRVWALRHNHKLYPCKLVISYANTYINNTELDPNPTIFTTYMAIEHLKKEGFTDILNLKNR